MSLPVAVDEIHHFLDFGQGCSLKFVFSLDFFQPVLHLERTHGESTFLLPFRKHPLI